MGSDRPQEEHSARHRVLIGFNRAKSVLTLVSGEVVSGLFLVLGWAGLRSNSIYFGGWRGLILVGAGAFSLVAMTLLLASNALQRFAVVTAGPNEVVLVYPLGLQRFMAGARLSVPADAGPPSLHRVGSRSRRLSQFEIECAGNRIEFSLSESALEADFEARFAARAAETFGRRPAPGQS